MEVSARENKEKINDNKADIKKIQETLYGNGREGLNTRMTVVEGKLDSILKVVWTVLGLVIALGITDLWRLLAGP